MTIQLFPSSPPPSPAASTAGIVCQCFQISEREIRTAIRRGAHSVPEVFAATHATGGCRGCIYRIERMLHGLPPFALQCLHCGGSAFLCDCATRSSCECLEVNAGQM